MASSLHGEKKDNSVSPTLTFLIVTQRSS